MLHLGLRRLKLRVGQNREPVFPGFVGELRVFHGTSVCHSTEGKPGWNYSPPKKTMWKVERLCWVRVCGSLAEG